MGFPTFHPERMLYILPFTLLVAGHGKFAACLTTIEGVIDGSINNSMGWDPVIHEFRGKINGFDYHAKVGTPITLTYEGTCFCWCFLGDWFWFLERMDANGLVGCKHMCGGNVPDPNDFPTALSVLTTWVC